jgi:hypothetical protein
LSKSKDVIEEVVDAVKDYTTATAILKALNGERQLRGLADLTLDQLGLKIV